MFKRKEKNIPDERIVKESNHLSAKMYYVVTVLTIISLIVKLVCRLPFYVYTLEILALLASIGYFIVCEMRKGILFVKKTDEALKDIHEEVLTKAMNVSFWILIVGELIYLLIVEKYLIWVFSYIAIWFVPALIITIASIKNGWLIWGTKKREVEGTKSLKKRVAIGALFYGVIVGFPVFYYDGSFHAEGILWMLGLAAVWGVLFYLLFAGFMKVAEKKANKDLKEQENKVEE